MASTSEKTFGNRLEHAQTLKTTVGQILGYAPDNTDLTVTNFDTFLTSVETANNNVAAEGELLAEARSDRRLAFFGNVEQDTGGLRTLAGRVRDYVGSMPGGKKSPTYLRVQKLTQKISNYRPPKKKVSPSPGATPVEKKKVSQSEASYGSLVQAGRDLAAAVGALSGYSPAALDLQPAALAATMKDLGDKNTAVASALVAAQKAVDARNELYENSATGLQTKFQQIKAAVASQFGRRSANYRSVSHIRY